MSSEGGLGLNVCLRYLTMFISVVKLTMMKHGIGHGGGGGDGDDDSDGDGDLDGDNEDDDSDDDDDGDDGDGGGGDDHADVVDGCWC